MVEEIDLVTSVIDSQAGKSASPEMAVMAHNFCSKNMKKTDRNQGEMNL